MAFVLTKVSDRGTTDPIVARTMLQASTLCNSFLDEEKTKAVLSIAHEVQGRLCACDAIHSELSLALDEVLRGVEANGLPIQAQGRVIEVPSIIGLESKAENFLYIAKLCLRDTARLFKPFFDHHFDENYKTFLEWATGKFGSDDALSKLVRDDRPWIARIIDMRNGIEHPTHKAGPVTIRNWYFDQSTAPPILRAPQWWQGDTTPTDVVHDMGVYVHNMLTFFEELLVLSLLKVNKHPFVDIGEIPEGDRNPQAPIRYRVIFKGPFPPVHESST